jgi:O-antigen/teichoic acid export membrane protein
MKAIFSRNKTRTTKWNFVFHYSTFLYNILIGVILVPIYINYIPNDLYGYWLVSGNILSWISIVDPGFAMIIQQRIGFNYGARNFLKIGQYISSSFIWTFIFILPILFIGFIVYQNFTQWLGVTNILYVNDLKISFLLSLIGLILSFASYTVTGINQGLQSSLGIGLIYFFANISSIFITFFLLTKSFGLIAIGLSFFCRGFLLLIGNLIYLYFRKINNSIKLKYDFENFIEVKKLLAFNFLGKIGELAITSLSGIYINYFLGPASVVIYRLTFLVPDSTKLFLLRPTLALMPSLTNLIGEGRKDKVLQLYLRLLEYMIWFSGLFFVGFICLNRSFLELWAGPKYFGGIFLNTILVFWVIISTFNQSISYVLYLNGEIKFGSKVFFLQALLYSFLLFVGVKYFGIIGAGLAILLSEIFIPSFAIPFYFLKIFKLDKSFISLLVRQFFVVSISSFFLIVSFFYFSPSILTWKKFIFVLIVIIVLYFLLIIIQSPKFRYSIKDLYSHFV